MQQINTNPGAGGPFAPPAGWDGSGDDYRELLRERYRSDHAARQQIAVVAKRLRSVSFNGHWAIEARKIAEAVLQTNLQRREAA